MSGLLAGNGRLLVVAVDHPLYSWPCHGLEDRAGLIEAVARAGADAVIASYGTIRDHRSAFGASDPILKLDLTSVALGGVYPSTEYVQAWSVEDAQRLGVGAVLTFVQLGASFELEALRTAGRVAAQADRAGLQYVCEIMPVQSAGFPKDDAPDAIAAAARTGSELGAHVIKTTMPDPPGAVREAVSCAAPVILAGGARTHDTAALLDSVVRARGRSGRGCLRPQRLGSRGSLRDRVAIALPGSWRCCVTVEPDRHADDVTGEVAIVTGASRGIGRATAVMLAARGARVMAVARDGALLAEVAASSGVDTLVADLVEPGACGRVVAETRSRLGPITTLVNNAGRGGLHDRPIEEQDREGWDSTLAANLTSPFELTRLVVGDMRAAGWGRIVMVSSTAGLVGAPAQGPYVASKHGLIGLMRSVAQDVGRFGGTCNAVLPGWVRTDMAEVDARQEAARRSIDVEEVWRERAASYPAGRVVEADEVASVICFLASRAASGVNGEAIRVALGSVW